MSLEAFREALRAEVDAAYESAARAEARFLCGHWCPSEAEIQAKLPAARALVNIGANGCGEPDDE